MQLIAKACCFNLKKKERIFMKLLNRIKAFFNYKGQKAELDLKAAEIREGKTFLHPLDNDDVVYCIRTNDVNIFLNYESNIEDNDLTIIDKKEFDAKKQSENKSKENKQKSSTKHHHKEYSNEFQLYKKRKFTISLYPDEYDSVVKSMKEYGYKRADFFLACVNTARKTTMKTAYNKIVKDHKSKALAEKELMKKHQSGMKKDA